MRVGLIQTVTSILWSLAVVTRSWEHGGFDSSPVTFTWAQGQGIIASAEPSRSNIFTVHNVIPHRKHKVYQALIKACFFCFF